MTKTELLQFYSNRKDEFTSRLAPVTQGIRAISNARLLIAAVFVVLLYFGFQQTYLLFILPLLIVGFIALVRVHAKKFEEKEHLENLIRLNKQEHDAVNGNASAFDSGANFIDPRHPYTHDLDIFGEGSLFQFTNRCNTLSGKGKFAARLANPLRSKEEIISNQKAIQELGGKIDFLQDFQAAGMEIKEQASDKSELFQWIERPSFVYGKRFYDIILIAIPLITIALIVGWIFSPMFRPFALLMAAVQWGIIGLHAKRTNAFHEYISRKKNILSKYAHLLHHLQGEKFQSPLLRQLAVDATDADKKVKRLANLVHNFDARLNAMTMLVMNSLFLYDLQCVYRLEKWKEENAADFKRWLDTITEAEVLCSFATFAFNHSPFAYATVNDQLTLSATAMGHPQIDASECVTNDFQLGGDHQVLIVTGANMAGKSTFLRTIGVNLVLALNGAPVFAKSFSCPVIELRTGMRTADSLKDHQSYFYAELDRLQGIMQELRKEIPLLILLDEILKGTNSTDKQAGSIELVKQLLPHPCLAVIATHDLVLGELEKQYPTQIKNYSFEANIENDQLSFDYKLKRGAATKMNATFLMRKMGIIPA